MRKENPDFPPMRTRCGDDANGGNISITRIIFNIQTENTVLSLVLSYNNKNPNSFMEKEFFFIIVLCWSIPYTRKCDALVGMIIRVIKSDHYHSLFVIIMIFIIHLV